MSLTKTIFTTESYLVILTCLWRCCWPPRHGQVQGLGLMEQHKMFLEAVLWNPTDGVLPASSFVPLMNRGTAVELSAKPLFWISKYDFRLARNQNTVMRASLTSELQSFLICLFFVYSSRLGLVSKSTFLTVSPWRHTIDSPSAIIAGHYSTASLGRAYNVRYVKLFLLRSGAAKGGTLRMNVA